MTVGIGLFREWLVSTKRFVQYQKTHCLPERRSAYNAPALYPHHGIFSDP
jgi:hypothetical protein